MAQNPLGLLTQWDQWPVMGQSLERDEEIRLQSGNGESGGEVAGEAGREREESRMLMRRSKMEVKGSRERGRWRHRGAAIRGRPCHPKIAAAIDTHLPCCLVFGCGVDVPHGEVVGSMLTA